MSAARRRGLGRGLDALLSREPPPPGLRTAPLDALRPNRFQPRSHFDESGLEELAGSIRSQGVVQPLVVTPESDGTFVIVAGERRWRAAKLAGLESVPIVIREITEDRELLELALVENLQRADLNAVEEAEAYQMLRESFGLSQEQIGERVGKGRSTVTNMLRLLRLPSEVQDLLRSGQITAGQARPLLAFPSKARQVEMARRASKEGLTARELESLAAAPRQKTRKLAKKSPTDVHSAAAAERLTQRLRTKVEILRRKRGGTIRIHFHSEEELMRLYDLIVGQEGKDR